MASPWFTPGASTASWFGQQPNSTAAASTSPQPAGGSSPLLSNIFGQQPGIGPAPAPSAPSGSDSANGIAGMVGQYGRPIASAFGQDYSRGLGGLLGLTNLGLGVSQGNPVQAAGGGLSAIGGLSGLLNNSPNLAGALGLGSMGTAGSGLGGMSALGSIGAGAGGLGGLLGIYGGIQGLMNGGSVPSGLMQLGSGLAGTYGALSSLAPTVFPSATAALAAAVPSLAPAIAGAAAAAGPAAMVAAPYAIAKLIQAWQAMGPDKANARQLGNRVSNIYGQLPGELSQIQSIPGIIGQMNSNSTPAEAASVLKQLNHVQDQFQTGGWESYQKSGQTGVESVGPGNMHANLSDVQTALDKMNPYMQLMDVNRIRAQDILGRAGWTPEQIQQQTGRYIGPQEWAMNLNAQSYKGGSGQVPIYQNYNPTFNAAFRPAGWQDPNSSPPAGSLYTNFGNVNQSLWDQLTAIKPGNFESGLNQLLNQYGGVNPGMVQMGFGQGMTLPTVAQYAPPVRRAVGPTPVEIMEAQRLNSQSAP